MTAEPEPSSQPELDPAAALLGSIDIYLLDQVLRGRIRPGMRVFDAGCGGGRNLAYFLRAGYDVAGIDGSADAIESVRELAARLAPGHPADRFRVAALDGFDGSDAPADVVVCNAVLHFARDDAQFDAMLRGAWSALAPGGLFFARLASSIGIEERVKPLGDGRFLLPDGSTRYLVDETRLFDRTESLGASLLDPIKTTNVQGLRCMTTWVLRRAEPLG